LAAGSVTVAASQLQDLAGLGGLEVQPCGSVQDMLQVIHSAQSRVNYEYSYNKDASQAWMCKPIRRAAFQWKGLERQGVCRQWGRPPCERELEGCCIRLRTTMLHHNSQMPRSKIQQLSNSPEFSAASGCKSGTAALPSMGAYVAWACGSYPVTRNLPRPPLYLFSDVVSRHPHQKQTIPHICSTTFPTNLLYSYHQKAFAGLAGDFVFLSPSQSQLIFPIYTSPSSRILPICLSIS